MIVVSDASPVTNLIQIHQLHVLKKLFGSVIIPVAVYGELCEPPEQKELIDNENWIIVQKVADEETAHIRRKRLDQGEAEAIALALHLQADYLLIDEVRGRAVAEEMGVKIVGLLGVLLKAKAVGIVAVVKPLIDDLITTAGFYIHEELYQKVLQAAREEK